MTRSASWTDSEPRTGKAPPTLRPADPELLPSDRLLPFGCRTQSRSGPRIRASRQKPRAGIRRLRGLRAEAIRIPCPKGLPQAPGQLRRKFRRVVGLSESEAAVRSQFKGEAKTGHRENSLYGWSNGSQKQTCCNLAVNPISMAWMWTSSFDCSGRASVVILNAQ